MDPKSAHKSYRKLSTASYEVSATQWILIYALSAILLAIVLFLVITQVISLYSPAKYDNLNVVSPNHPTPIQNQTVDTSNWKTYKSPKYGYSFHYPSVWTVIDAGPAEGTITEIYSWKGQRENGFVGRKIKKSEVLIEIYEIDNPKRLTIQQWYATDTTPLREKILQEEAVVTTNGLSGVKRLWEDNEGQKSVSIDLASGIKIYRISGYPTDTYLKEYEQVVQSFKQP